MLCSSFRCFQPALAVATACFYCCLRAVTAAAAGVLTETTAELAAALTLAAARRVPEADVFMRTGQYKGWLPNLFVGQLLQNKTVGIIGAGRIGAAYARMMVEGHKMNLIYFDPYPNKKLEAYLKQYGELLAHNGEPPIYCKRVETVEEVLKEADVSDQHCSVQAQPSCSPQPAWLPRCRW